jgi:hypothetical protein
MAEHRSFRLTAATTEELGVQPSLAAGSVYSYAITLALAQQAVVLVFASLILDGGVVFRFCVAAAIASWVCTLLILLRRPKQPTPFDLAIIKYGFWPALPIVFVLGAAVFGMAGTLWPSP